MLAASQETELMNVLNSFLNRFNSISVHLTVQGRFARYDESGFPTSEQNMPMRSRTRVLLSGARHRIQRQLSAMFEDIEDRVESAQLNGSGHTLQFLTSISLNIARRDYAGSADTYGEMFVSHLTDRQKEACADVAATERDGCLFSAVAQAFLAERAPSAVHPVGSREWDETRFFIREYMNTSSLPRPMPLSKLDKFEKMNRNDLDFAINVFMKGSYAQHGEFAGGASGVNDGAGGYFFFPIRVSERRHKARKIVNLLLLRSGGDCSGGAATAATATADGGEDDCDDGEGELHFVYIRNLDKLLGLRYDETVCENCMQRFGKGAPISRHQRLCDETPPQAVRMPVRGADGSPPIIKFKPGRKRFKNSIIAFCDFEAANFRRARRARRVAGTSSTAAAAAKSLRPGGDEEEEDWEDLEGDGSDEDLADMERDVLEDVEHDVLAAEEEGRERAERDEERRTDGGRTSYTRVLAGQRAISYSIIFLTDEGRLLLEYTHASDTNLLRNFYMDLHDARKKLVPLLNDMSETRPILSPRQSAEFESAERCWICEERFDVGGVDVDPKVLDHAHSSLQYGRYLGAAHRSCNSARQHQRLIPVYIHNMQNYDANFLLEGFQLDDISKLFKLSAMAQNTEKFRNIRVGCFNFLDSFHFLQGSLSGLVQQLADDGHPFPLLDDFVHEDLNGRQNKALLLRKGVFPYELVRSVRQMSEMTSFPEHSTFYSRLAEKNVSTADYEHGRAVYRAANCTNFESYLILYNRLDVILLAEVITAYRNLVYREHRLDVSQFLSG